MHWKSPERRQIPVNVGPIVTIMHMVTCIVVLRLNFYVDSYNSACLEALRPYKMFDVSGLWAMYRSICNNRHLPSFFPSSALETRCQQLLFT